METEMEMNKITEAEERKHEDGKDKVQENEAKDTGDEKPTNEYQKLQCETDNIYSVVKMSHSSLKQQEDVHRKARLYWRISAFLLVLCLFLMAVVLALVVKLNAVQSSQTCPERVETVDTTPIPVVCSQDMCQRMYPSSTVEIIEHQCSECGRDWIKFDNFCYFISNERLTWQESRAMCQKFKGDLVIINSERVQRFLTEKGGMMYWIGLSYSETNEWKWINNTPLNQSYWDSGIKLHGKDHCALLRGRKSFMNNWYSNPCRVYSQYICQKG